MGEVTLTRQERLAIVLLKRPDRQNMLDHEMVEQLGSVAEELERHLPRAVVVTGAGDTFSNGLDLNPTTNPAVEALLHAVQRHDRPAIEDLLDRTRSAVDRLTGLPIPVIAAVNGPAWGAGAELALRCDLRVMDGSATLCMIGVRMGLTPVLGGGPALTRLVGPARAADILLTARKVPAIEAFSLGLANRVTEPGQALDTALRLAFSISRNGQHAVRAALRLVRDSAGLDTSAAVALERDAAAHVIQSGDFLIAMRAALNKTEAVFPDVP